MGCSVIGENEMSILQIARQNVADKWDQPYTKNAILRGEWDRGEIVKQEYDRISNLVPVDNAVETEEG